MECNLCNSECSILADLGDQPLANKYPANVSEINKEKFWNLKGFDL